MITFAYLSDERTVCTMLICNKYDTEKIVTVYSMGIIILAINDAKLTNRRTKQDWAGVGVTVFDYRHSFVWLCILKNLNID